jgi:hypothetical protein
MKSRLFQAARDWSELAPMADERASRDRQHAASGQGAQRFVTCPAAC